MGLKMATFSKEVVKKWTFPKPRRVSAVQKIGSEGLENGHL